MDDDPRQPFPQRVRRKGGHDLLESLLVVAAFVSLPQLADLLPESAKESWRPAVSIAIQVLVTLAALAYVLAFRKTQPRELGFERMVPHDGLVLLRWGFVSGGLLAAIGGAGLLILNHRPEWLPEGVETFKRLRQGNASVLDVVREMVLVREFGVLLMIKLVVVAPLLEEVIFRGFLYGSLRRELSVRVSVVASALVFGFAHGAYPVSQIVGGIVFALVYERTRTLMVPVLLHMAGNASLVALSWWVEQSLVA